MSWRQITTQDLYAEISAAEQQGLNGANANGTNEITAPDGILAKTVREARGAIIAGGNQLGAEDYLPDQLIEDVLAIVRWRWITTAPKLKFLQTEAREKLYNDARERLRDVANGKEKIELPPVPLANAAPVNQLQRVSSKPRQTVAICNGVAVDQMNGLF